MYKGNWGIPFGKPEISQELVEAGLNKLLIRALALRGIKTEMEARNFISCQEELADPLKLKDMDKASNRLRDAIANKEAIAVHGDYDVDGITSCCLMTDYIKSKGLECFCHIPNREEEGYGLSNSALDEFKSRGVSLVITVDCGITAVEEAQHAKDIGVDLIITDHHECLEGKLPDAVAVVDYKRPDDEYPNSILAGVGVAFKLACACEGDQEKILERYADLVAIGTVADVMPLLGENRLLVKRGLKKLKDEPRPGIQALMNYTEDGIPKEKTQELSSTSISFNLAPKLNAAGRMGKASTAAMLLNAQNEEDAKSLAVELNELNKERKHTENEIMKSAEKLLKDYPEGCPIVLADSDWHQGVIGIAASRLSEKYCVPSIMICVKDGVGKGSCRSYGNFNLHSALKACEEHLISFGGHMLAAGLNIKEENVDDFREALKDYYLSNKPEAVPDVECDILIDSPELLTVENVESLECLEPFGTSNAKPKMCIYGAEVKSLSQVGADSRHMKMRILFEGMSFDCIFFSKKAEDLGISEGSIVDLAFTPQKNEYRDKISVQLVLSAARLHSAKELCEAVFNKNDDVLWSASKYIPERREQVIVWNHIKCNNLVLGYNYEAMAGQCPKGMSLEHFCICVEAFLQAGLLAPGEGGNIYGASIAEFSGKKNLEDTNVYKGLRKWANERSC